MNDAPMEPLDSTDAPLQGLESMIDQSMEPPDSADAPLQGLESSLRTPVYPISQSSSTRMKRQVSLKRQGSVKSDCFLPISPRDSLEIRRPEDCAAWATNDHPKPRVHQTVPELHLLLPSQQDSVLAAATAGEHAPEEQMAKPLDSICQECEEDEDVVKAPEEQMAKDSVCQECEEDEDVVNHCGTCNLSLYVAEHAT